jgi:hypothetical protein
MRFIHINNSDGIPGGRRLCVAIAEAEEHWLFGFAFTAPTDQYNKKLGRTKASHRALGGSREFSRVIAKTDTRFRTLPAIWTALHELKACEAPDVFCM